jgi:hypothetical protein
MPVATEKIGRLFELANQLLTGDAFREGSVGQLDHTVAIQQGLLGCANLSLEPILVAPDCLDALGPVDGCLESVFAACEFLCYTVQLLLLFSVSTLVLDLVLPDGIKSLGLVSERAKFWPTVYYIK